MIPTTMRSPGWYTGSGPLVMWAEYLCKWTREAIREEEPDATHWLKLIVIVQAKFRDGILIDESTWHTAVLILKGEGRGLGGVDLVEVLWNTVTGLLNRRFASSIHFHDVLHGF